MSEGERGAVAGLASRQEPRLRFPSTLYHAYLYNNFTYRLYSRLYLGILLHSRSKKNIFNTIGIQITSQYIWTAYYRTWIIYPKHSTDRNRSRHSYSTHGN